MSLTQTQDFDRMIRGVKPANEMNPPPAAVAEVPLPNTGRAGTATESAQGPNKHELPDKNVVLSATAPTSSRTKAGTQKRGRARGCRSTPSTRRSPGLSDEV